MTRWPDFLLSTARGLVLVTRTGSRVVHDRGGIHYGISWNDKELFVACRGDAGAAAAVAVLDRESFAELGAIAGRFDDIHQVLWHDGALYVAASGRDTVVECRDGAQTDRRWLGDGLGDQHHVNSLWHDGAHFWAVCHNWVSRGVHPTSMVVRLEGWQEAEVLELGADAHNVCIIDDQVLLNSSLEGATVRADRQGRERTVTRIARWTRGMAITDRCILVGASPFARRSSRTHGDCAVLMLDRDTLDVVDHYVLHGMGAAMDLRVVSEADLAHQVR